MSWWPFKRDTTPPLPSIEAIRAIQRADRELEVAKRQRVEASEISMALEVSRRTNGFGHALEASMTKTTRKVS